MNNKVRKKQMALSAAQRKANDKYIKENYAQVKLSMPKAEAQALDAYCKVKGYTKAGFIRDLIKKHMEMEPITDTERVEYVKVLEEID